MSSPVLKPISDCLPLIEFFHNKLYAIPPFQRGYAWKKDQIDEMLADIFEFIDSGEPVYLMGQVIVTHSKSDGQYILVDGQQRTTSLLLLLIAIQKKFRAIPDILQNDELEYKYSQLNNLIRIFHNGQSRPRIISEDSREFNDYIGALIRDAALPNIEGWTQQNLRDAYIQISGFIDTNWPESREVPFIFDRIVQGIHLVRLELPSYDEAVKVFERINNRGLSLSSADLVKNVLYEIVHDEHRREYISQMWSKAAAKIYSCQNNRIRSMEYLLRSIIIIEKGELVSNLEMRDDWRALLHASEHETMHFVQQLPERANHLFSIDRGKTPLGHETEYNQSGKYFGTVQHFPILLAGAHLNPTAYDMLAHIIEDRTIISLLSKERPQNYEKIVPKWGRIIRSLPVSSSPDEVRSALLKVNDDWNDLISVAYTNFRLLRTRKSTEKKRIRYMLARVSRKIQLNALISAVPGLDLMLTTNRSVKDADAIGYDIEHVYPLSLSDNNAMFDSIGNLVLAHPVDQRGAQNKLPADKLNVYLSSNLLLTQSLCEQSEIGGGLSDKSKPVLQLIHQLAKPSLNVWGSQSVEQRLNLYWHTFLTDLAIRPTSDEWRGYLEKPYSA